jgi:hypothetical protein
MEQKQKQNTHCGKITKSNVKIVEIGKIDTPNSQIHDCSFSWLDVAVIKQAHKYVATS